MTVLRSLLLEVFFCIKGESMKLKKLDNSFYIENSHLKNAMDNYEGNWDRCKTRGYGIVVIKVNNLTFAIPLRSNVNRKASYVTKRSKDKAKGLDYSKALLIKKSSYVFDEPFFIPQDEKKKLQSKGTHIRTSFEKYVRDYIKAVQTSDTNILDSFKYLNTTLVNYHDELGLTSAT